MRAHGPQLVEATDLRDYPVSASERLDAHYFVQFNRHRWRGSTLRKRAFKDPEVGFFALELIFTAHGETPLGTLPCEDEDLAFLLHMPVGQWRELRGRDVSPLHGWYPVRCDNGEIRLAHEVVTEVVTDALASKRNNQARYADDRRRKRLATIRAHLAEIPGAGRFAAIDDRVEEISDWIEARFPGGSATRKRVLEALNDLGSRG